MNEVYDIIVDNQETYAKKNGKLDEKLDELMETSQLRKRGENKNKNKKYRFISRNKFQKNNKSNFLMKKDEEYIPVESNLVIDVCPVLNYYVVIAYLSEEIVNKVKLLPNVINCTKSKTLTNYHAIGHDYDLNHHHHNNNNIFNSSQYYNINEILNETHWNGVSILEHEFDVNYRNTHLSILSQGKYDSHSKIPYDNNYYYPSSAGKGIDIYIIDDGLDTSFSEENFDTYEGTPDERIIKCDGIFNDGHYNPAPNEKNCNIKSKFMASVNHGTFVAISALGAVNGAARKANLHMLATHYKDYDQLSALEYIKQHAIPHKTVVNISRGCEKYYDCFSPELQDKINELVDDGIIVFVAIGNTGSENCSNQSYNTGVIFVAAINNEEFRGEEEEGEDHLNMENVYQIADYSSYGECVDLFSPGTIRVTDKTTDNILYMESGTSFASPIVAGLASTLMSDDPNTQYNYESMKEKLINLSLKDAIKGLDEATPNRLVNNGKRTIYGPTSCSDPAGRNQCNTNECCSKYGFCVNAASENPDLQSLCLLENGCASEFGYCTTNKCGPDNNSRKCLEDECCSREGNCVKISKDTNDFCFLENGCLHDFSSQCLSFNLTNIDHYDEKYHEIIFNYNCKKEVKQYKETCDFNQVLYDKDSFHINEHTRLCNNYQQLKCKEYFNSPYSFAPSCEKGNNIDEIYISDDIQIVENDLFCAKKDPKISNDFCIDSYQLFDNILYEISEVDVKSFCGFNECRESLLHYFEKVYANEMSYKEKGEKVNEKELEIYENNINYLSSAACIGY